MKNFISAFGIVIFTLSLQSAFCETLSISDIQDLNLRVALRTYSEVDFNQTNQLRLNGFHLTDIAPLGKLTQLERLELYNNQISNIAPLTALTNLKSLYLGKNRLTDISPLSNMLSLQKIDLQKNHIRDLSPLQNLPNLKELDLRGMPLNVENLKYWQFTESLQVTDVDGKWHEIKAEEKAKVGIRDGKIVPAYQIY